MFILRLEVAIPVSTARPYLTVNRHGAHNEAARQLREAIPRFLHLEGVNLGEVTVNFNDAGEG